MESRVQGEIVPLTEEQLAAIDVIVNAGLPTYSQNTHPDVDLMDDVVRAAGFAAYGCLPDFRSRRPYERSLWAWRMEDGRCVPEIYVLATLRYGLLPPTVNAAWRNGASNKSMDNVVLQVLRDPSVDGRLKSNQFGVRSGTPEYRKMYYSKPENRERQKMHARNSAARRRQIVDAAKDLTDPKKLQEMCLRILMPDGRRGEEDDRLFNVLNDPQVVQRLVNSAHLLMAIVDDISFEDALTQARDKYLEQLTAPVEVTSDLGNI